MLTDKCGLSNSGRDSAPPFIANGLSYGPAQSAMFGDAIEFAGNVNSNAHLVLKDAGLFIGSQICIMFWVYVYTLSADGMFVELWDDSHALNEGPIHLQSHLSGRTWINFCTLS